MHACCLFSTDYFSPSHLKLLNRAVDVSEEIISDYFSLTTDYWLKNPYEVKTMKEAGEIVIPEGAYAHLMKYGKVVGDKDSGTDDRHLYRIVVYDCRVLEATGGREAVLWPFLVYIMTHELIHITRFARFECMVSLDDKRAEEDRVHDLTSEVLARVPVSGLGDVIEFFDGRHQEQLLV